MAAMSKEQKREYNRKYRAEHRDELKLKWRQYYAEHRDELRARCRCVRQENLDEFHRRERRQREQPGYRERQRDWYTRNRDRILAAEKRRYQREKAEDPTARARKTRDQHLRRKYGLSLEQYEWLLHNQKQQCALCHQPMKPGQAVVDHEHVTGEIRGLTHDHCNKLLGFAHDSPKLLKQAIQYLAKSSATVKKALAKWAETC